MNGNMRNTIHLHKKVWWWWLFVILLALGNLQRVQVLQTVGVGVHEILAAGCVVAWTYAARNSVFHTVKKLFYHKEAWMLVVGIFIGWVNAVSDDRFLVTTPLYVVRVLSLVVFGVWATKKMLLKLSLDDVIESVLGLSVVVAVLGWLQYVLLPDTRFLAILGWDDHYYRLISTWLDPTYTGWLLAIGSLTWILFWRKDTWLRFAVAAFLTVTLAFTYSRSSYLAFGVGVAGVVTATFFSFWKSRFKQISAQVSMQLLQLGMLVVILGVSILLLPKPGGEGTDLTRTQSIVAKQSSVKQVIQNSKLVTTPRKARPTLLFGTGLFTRYTEQSTTDIPSHSSQPDSLIVVLFQLGILGSFCLLLLAKRLQPYSSDPLLVAVLSATFAHSLFTNTWFHPLVLGVLVPLISARILSSKSK